MPAINLCEILIEFYIILGMKKNCNYWKSYDHYFSLSSLMLKYVGWSQNSRNISFWLDSYLHDRNQKNVTNKLCCRLWIVLAVSTISAPPSTRMWDFCGMQAKFVSNGQGCTANLGVTVYWMLGFPAWTPLLRTTDCSTGFWMILSPSCCIIFSM